MQPHVVNAKSLARLPLIFAGLGVLQFAALERSLVSPGAIMLALVSALIGIGFGVVRDLQVRVWQDGHGDYLSQGTGITLLLWALLLLTKVALGAFGAIAG
jgi:hypothetical protein